MVWRDGWHVRWIGRLRTVRTAQGVTGAGAGVYVPHGTDGGAPMVAAMLAGAGGIAHVTGGAGRDGRGRCRVWRDGCGWLERKN